MYMYMHMLTLIATFRQEKQVRNFPSSLKLSNKIEYDDNVTRQDAQHASACTHTHTHTHACQGGAVSWNNIEKTYAYTCVCRYMYTYTVKLLKF